MAILFRSPKNPPGGGGDPPNGNPNQGNTPPSGPAAGEESLKKLIELGKKLEEHNARVRKLNRKINLLGKRVADARKAVKALEVMLQRCGKQCKDVEDAKEPRKDGDGDDGRWGGGNRRGFFTLTC